MIRDDELDAFSPRIIHARAREDPGSVPVNSKSMCRQ